MGALDLAGAGPNRTRDPVERAQLVDDRTLDSGDGEGLELDLALHVEALDRTDQAQQAVGDQVGFLDVRRQTRGHATGDELDQRRVGDDESLARFLVAFELVTTPQLTQLDRFDVRFHLASLGTLSARA